MSQRTLEPAQVNGTASANRVVRPVLAASSAVLPARLFLGIVFLYAGIDKLTDPEFFNPASPGYIGNQLAGFATISPIGGFLKSVAVPNAALFGWLSALGEVAIGLGTLAGLLSRAAALGGMLLSLTLWLSASWATDPFYLGSDLPYAMFFLVLAVGGPHPVLSLDGQIARWVARRKAVENPQAASYQFNEQEQLVQTFTKEEAAVLARRRFLTVTGATVAAGTFGIVAWGNALAGRSSNTTSPSKTDQPSNPANTTSPATGSATGVAPAAPAITAASTSATTAESSGPAPATTAAAIEGTVLTTLSALPSGTGKSFNTPDTNQPFLVIRGEGNTVHAFSAICTHQGCTVAFNQAANSIICPCHGAEYNPTTGAVTGGPAPRALATIKVTVDASGNVIYTTK